MGWTGWTIKFWSRHTKRRLFLQSVVMLMAGFLSARLAAQTSAAPTFLMSLTCPSTVGGCRGPLSSPWTLKEPTSVAVDPNTGNLWISDTGNDVVVEVDPNSSTVMAFAG